MNAAGDARVLSATLVVLLSVVAQITMVASAAISVHGNPSTPTVTITPLTLAQFENYTIKGSGFTPNGLVLPFIANIGQDFFPADSNGNFTSNPFQANLVGQIPIYCIDAVTGRKSNTVTLTVTGNTPPVSSATEFKTSFFASEPSGINQTGSVNPLALAPSGQIVTLGAGVLALVASALALAYIGLRRKRMNLPETTNFV
jgi:hypothetical protein